MESAYVYDGTFEGLMTAVFDAYDRHEDPACISESDNFQMLMDVRVYNVEQDEKKSERVMNGIVRKIGQDGLKTVYRAFLSEEKGREMTIFSYLKLVFAIGSEAKRFIGNDCVMTLYEMARKTGNEAHLLKGFLRFSELDNGVLYAEFAPKTDCVSLVAGHFRNRLSSVPFIINDRTRKKAAIYTVGDFDILPYDSFVKPEVTEKEAEFRSMWKSFYRTVSIAERKNEACRRTHMPKRFWRYMCEMEACEVEKT